MATADYYSLKVTAAQQDLQLSDFPFFNRLELGWYMMTKVPNGNMGTRVFINFPELKRVKTLTNDTMSYQYSTDIYIGDATNTNNVYEHDYNYPLLISNETTGRERNVLRRIEILDENGNPATSLFSGGGTLFLKLYVNKHYESLWLSEWIAGSHGKELGENVLAHLRGAH